MGLFEPSNVRILIVLMYDLRPEEGARMARFIPKMKVADRSSSATKVPNNVESWPKSKPIREWYTLVLNLHGCKRLKRKSRTLGFFAFSYDAAPLMRGRESVLKNCSILNVGATLYSLSLSLSCARKSTRKFESSRSL